MSTATPTGRVATPKLVEGDHLDQPEFHRRYEAMPPGFKAELIDGVVSMPSPVSDEHSDAHSVVIGWLIFYAMKTPGVKQSVDLTTILGSRSEPQPDAALRIRPESGGRTTRDRGFVRGAPEFVIEVAKSSRYVDLGPKLAEYARAGVAEYLVLALDPDQVYWFRQTEGALARVVPDPDGLYRSTSFPGLWLDPAALLSGDLVQLQHVVELGMATPEHAAFVARLAANRAGGA